jgi:hypothetical protein
MLTLGELHADAHVVHLAESFVMIGKR